MICAATLFLYLSGVFYLFFSSSRQEQESQIIQGVRGHGAPEPRAP